MLSFIPFEQGCMVNLVAELKRRMHRMAALCADTATILATGGKPVNSGRKE
jgi:hypothetical protein